MVTRAEQTDSYSPSSGFSRAGCVIQEALQSQQVRQLLSVFHPLPSPDERKAQRRDRSQFRPQLFSVVIFLRTQVREEKNATKARRNGPVSPFQRKEAWDRLQKQKVHRQETLEPWSVEVGPRVAPTYWTNVTY